MRKMLERVRSGQPRIHCITNYVTANDCANILLACGGSPIMADAVEEVEDVTGLCDGLYLNMGTLNPNRIASMMAAGRRANALKHPVILDPVGIGASGFRTEAAHQLLDEIAVDVIRGNISEIKAIMKGKGTTPGVDADTADAVTEQNLAQTVRDIKNYAKRLQTILAVTGAIDIVADSQTAYCIYNGHPMMSRITGSGCQLSALTAAYMAANPEAMLEAAASAVCAMGVCGEIAYKRMNAMDGNASYRNYVIDAVYNLDGEALEQYANYIKM